MVGEPDEIEVTELELDEEVEDHIARHSVTLRNLNAVLGDAPRFFRNLPERRATHIMIGVDDQGRILYVPLLRTAEHGRWRPISGWESTFARRIIRNIGDGELNREEEILREAEEFKDTEEEVQGLVPVKARVSANPGVVYSLRLSRDDLDRISNAAAKQGVRVSAFLRMAALAAAEGEISSKAGEKASALQEVRKKTSELVDAINRL